MPSPQTAETVNSTAEQPAAMIADKHREALGRTLRITGMVGAELAVNVVDSGEMIPPAPGVYLIEGEVDTEHFGSINNTVFDISPVSLSGKADSGHAVLPGRLTVSYTSGPETRRDLEVAAKGYYKRPFTDGFERVKREIAISKLQEQAGEIAFKPVAVVIAPPPYHGKGTDHADYDILLVTRLEEATDTLDNVPWQLGFQMGNLDAAEAAFAALGRFNTVIGSHGDAKIKNVAQQPDGTTSMIDFETSRQVDLSRANALEAATVAHDDLGSLFDTMADRGFFTSEIERANEVIARLGEIYLDYWADHPREAQDAVYEQVVEIVDQNVTSAMKHASMQNGNGPH